MNKLHIISARNGDIRPMHATDDEILGIAEGLVEHSGHLLASVTVDDDGEIVATPLGRVAIDAAAEGARARRAQAQLDATSDVAKIIAALDLSLELQAQTAKLGHVDSVSWNNPLTLWPDANPFAEEALRTWVAAHEFVARESWSHYPDGTSIRAIEVTDGRGGYVGRAQWRCVRTDETPEAKADKERRERHAAVYPACEAAS